MENVSRYELLRNKFRCQCPYLQKCCCCIPLRMGLLFCGYLKLVSAVVLIGTAFMPLAWMVVMLKMENGFDVVTLLIVILSIAVLVTDLVFSIVFIVSAHKKSRKAMQAYYYYMIGLLVALTILFVLFIILFMVSLNHWYDNDLIISTSVVYILDTSLHCYLTMLVRSGVYKFENDFNFRYIRNIDVDPVCVMES
uniref:Uncharacterized protein n=1 Tax=Bombyx mori TaxID=7091 RepID=A0A8R1WIH8_BOMMO|nr:uncharacterized protein LOC101737207 isoform X1 [Bombyx mori]